MDVSGLLFNSYWNLSMQNDISRRFYRQVRFDTIWSGCWKQNQKLAILKFNLSSASGIEKLFLTETNQYLGMLQLLVLTLTVEVAVPLSIFKDTFHD